MLVPVTRTALYRNYASRSSSKPVTRKVPTLRSSPPAIPTPSESSTGSATSTIPAPLPYKRPSALNDLEASPSQPPAQSSPTAPQPSLQDPAPQPQRVKDPARGAAAASEFVKTGHLPAAYKWAGVKQTALLVSVVLLIVLTPVLFGRVVQGNERKRFVLGAEKDGLEGEEGIGGGGREGEGLLREERAEEMRLKGNVDGVVGDSRYREG